MKRFNINFSRAKAGRGEDPREGGLKTNKPLVISTNQLYDFHVWVDGKMELCFHFSSTFVTTLLKVSIANNNQSLFLHRHKYKDKNNDTREFCLVIKHFTNKFK